MTATMQDAIKLAEENGKLKAKIEILQFISDELDKLKEPLKQWSEPALHRTKALESVFDFIKQSTKEPNVKSE